MSEKQLFINSTGRVLNMHGMDFFPGSVVASALSPGPPWSRFNPAKHGHLAGKTPPIFDLDHRQAEYHGDAARHPEKVEG